MAAKSAEKPDWSPPKVSDEGHELIGGYPASGPARALAISKAGRKTDPDGILTPEQIAAFAPAPSPAPKKAASTRAAPKRSTKKAEAPAAPAPANPDKPAAGAPQGSEG